MDLVEFGKQLQALRKARRWSQEALIEALDKLACAGPPAEYRVIDSRLLSRWERAHTQKGRIWKPTRTYTLYLIRLFAPQLDLAGAVAWAAQASYAISAAELQTWFPAPNPEAADPQLPQAAGDPMPPHNLPQQLTPFIGRSAELAALDALLADRQVRLVTILAPGGMGKTRLALALAERHLTNPRFSDGVYMVALAPLSKAEHIVPTLASILSLTLRSDGEAGGQAQQVIHDLRSKAMLLLFDNFEHLLSGTEFIVQLLQGAPNLRILTTSRERLGILGEQLFPLQGLELGQSDCAGNATTSAAVQLFCQRAKAVLPGLEFDENELAHVAQLCQLVGGMPLAIDLAAGWIEILSPAEIVVEVRRSLDFLATDRRSGPASHRSMRAVFESTWQRLEERERAFFAQLAIFRGGFRREAAELIAEASLRLLSTLVGKALIQHDRKGGRYTIHELLRQFAEEKLQRSPQVWHESRERHAVYYTRLLQQQEQRLQGEEQGLAVAAIEAEIENIRIAWQWAITQKKVAELDGALESLAIFYGIKYWHQEGADAFAQLAAAMTMAEPTGQQGILLARALTRQATMLEWVTWRSGFTDQTLAMQKIEDLYRQSLVLCQRLHAGREIGLALRGLLERYLKLGQFEEALDLGQQALPILTECGDHRMAAEVLVDMGFFYFQIGKSRQAIAHFRQSIKVSEESGNPPYVLAFILLAQAQEALGEYDDAQKSAEIALETVRNGNNKLGIAWSLQLLGSLAWHNGNHATAQAYSEKGLAMLKEIGLSGFQARSLNTLGNIAYALGQYEVAKGHFCAALAVLPPDLASWTLNIADSLTGIALLLNAEGKAGQALELLQLALGMPTIKQDTKEQATRLLTDVRTKLPEARNIATAQTTRPLATVIAELLRSRSP